MTTMPLSHKRMANTGMRDRLFTAWYLFQARDGESRSQEWLAESVSRELGLEPEDYLTQGSVSRWLKGSEPGYTTLLAIARVLGVDPGWLAFGADSKAPAPTDPMQDGMRRLLLPEDSGD